MLHLAERVGSCAACSGVKFQLRKLVLQASAFSHILDLEEGPSTADVFGHPLWKLSPSRRGTVLQEVTRAVLQRAYPDSQFHDPVPGNFDSGRARHLHQAEWDWTMDGRRVECKSASLSWNRQKCHWRAYFSGVKLAHDGFRQHALFDDLLLVLLSPDSLDIVQHDLRTGVSTAGHRTGPSGFVIEISAACRQLCWKEARKQILAKLCEGQGSCVPVAQVLLSDPCVHSTLQKHLSRYPAMAYGDTPFDSLPLSLLSPRLRGLRVQQIALEIDQMLHPHANFSIVCEGTTASGARRSSQNASVDWVRNETRVEVKHGKLNFEYRQKRWKCTFHGIKCAFPGTRSRDLYDELWLVMYSPLGLHFIKHHGQLGLSTTGLLTEVSGHVLQVYGPSKEEDSTVAAHVVIAKLLRRGCLLLATVWWDSNMCTNSHPTRVTVNCGPNRKVRSGISIDRVVDRFAVAGDRLRYNMPGHCVCRCGAVRYQPHTPPPATSTPPPAAPPPATPPSRCTVWISRTIVLQYYPSLCVCIYIYINLFLHVYTCEYVCMQE